MNKGLALISDIHFSLNTLKEAESSLRQALQVASDLNYTLVIAGDLNDTKAIIRAEVANRLLDILKDQDHYMVPIAILIGNHDLINEKGLTHSLNFLAELPNVIIYDKPGKLLDSKVNMIPYQTSQEAFKDILKGIRPGSTIIMHQGVSEAFMGDYMQDKSAISAELLKDYTVISGHYHRHQQVGTVTYVGTPYTVTFGEAKDGPKGFLVVDEHGRVRHVQTNLRKHVIVERDIRDITRAEHGIKSIDLLWLKVTGPAEELKRLNKEELGKRFIGHSNFRLDLIPNDESSVVENTSSSTPTELLDQVIDAYPTSNSRKSLLKLLAKEVLS